MITVPHFAQEMDKTCVPASVRMLLAYLGIERSEREIAALLGATPDGTHVMNRKSRTTGVKSLDW